MPRLQSTVSALPPTLARCGSRRCGKWSSHGAGAARASTSGSVGSATNTPGRRRAVPTRPQQFVVDACFPGSTSRLATRRGQRPGSRAARHRRPPASSRSGGRRSNGTPLPVGAAGVNGVQFMADHRHGATVRQPQGSGHGGGAEWGRLCRTSQTQCRGTPHKAAMPPTVFDRGGRSVVIATPGPVWETKL